jgi:hypothetical protein
MTMLDDKERINTYNLECQKLLFYCNSLIAGVLNQRTINKNAQIAQIKNEFNRRVVLLKNNFLINVGASANEREDVRDAYAVKETDDIPIVCSLIPNNIMLNITLKKS